MWREWRNKDPEVRILMEGVLQRLLPGASRNFGAWAVPSLAGRTCCAVFNGAGGEDRTVLGWYLQREPGSSCSTVERVLVVSYKGERLVARSKSLQ